MRNNKPADDAGWIVAITTVAATGLYVGSHLPPNVALTAGVLAVALVLATVALAVRTGNDDDDLHATPPGGDRRPDPQMPQRRAITGGFFTLGAGSAPAAYLDLGWSLGLVYAIGVVVAAIAVAALTHHIAQGRAR